MAGSLLWTASKVSVPSCAQHGLDRKAWSLNPNYCRGLNNYQYLLYLWYNGPQNPILIIQAPILSREG